MLVLSSSLNAAVDVNDNFLELFSVVQSSGPAFGGFGQQQQQQQQQQQASSSGTGAKGGKGAVDVMEKMLKVSTAGCAMRAELIVPSSALSLAVRFSCSKFIPSHFTATVTPGVHLCARHQR